MLAFGKEVNAFSSLPTPERLLALKRIIPRARVEEVLARTGQDRSFCSDCRPGSWSGSSSPWACSVAIAIARSSAGCNRFVAAEPGAFYFLRGPKRLGVAPLRFLANQVIRLQGKPTTPGAFYRGMRTMALDGFVVDVPDTPANDRAFGRPGSGRAPAAFPQARVLAFCETGSHVLWRFLIKPHSAARSRWLITCCGSSRRYAAAVGS